MSTTPNFFTTPAGTPAKIDYAGATSLYSLLAGAANGSRCDAVSVVSTDTVARTVQLWLTTGAGDQLLLERSVPAGAGTGGSSPPVQLLDASFWDALGNASLAGSLPVKSGATLKVSSSAQITNGKFLYVTPIAWDA